MEWYECSGNAHFGANNFCSNPAGKYCISDEAIPSNTSAVALQQLHRLSHNQERSIQRMIYDPVNLATHISYVIRFTALWDPKRPMKATVTFNINNNIIITIITYLRPQNRYQLPVSGGAHDLAAGRYHTHRHTDRAYPLASFDRLFSAFSR